MTNTSPTIVFFGNERLATGVTTTAPTLQVLIDNGYTVAAVILNNETAVSRKNRTPEIADIAAKHNIPTLYPSKLSDIADRIASFNAQAGVLVAYGKMVPDSIINIFPRGIINIHPSNLPLHRGPTPLENTILSGESETAVSIMQLVKQMDAGPVYAQRTTPVPGKITKQAFAEQLLQIGSKMIIQHLPAILDGTLQPTAQDDSHATYDSLIQKSDGQLDWTKPATQLEREIRAYAKWPKSNAQIGNKQFIVTQTDVVNTSGTPGEYEVTKKELLVYCGTGALQILKVQPVNKKEMPIQAFLSGYSL